MATSINATEYRSETGPERGTQISIQCGNLDDLIAVLETANITDYDRLEMFVTDIAESSEMFFKRERD